jgi:hypothetical protein
MYLFFFSTKMSNTLLNQNALIESIKSQIDSIEQQFISNREKLHDLHIELQQAEEIAYQCVQDMEKTKNTPIDKPLKTKVKWVLDVDTYRVAIITKDGILQVKSVTDGAGDCHIDNCNCVPCWEFNNNVPWRLRKPLNKVLFTNEADWRASLPAGGEIIFSPPELTNRERVLLLTTPLSGANDALKLEELHARFPGKKIIYKMNYDYSGTSFQIEAFRRIHDGMPLIYCRETNESFANLREFSLKPTEIFIDFGGKWTGGKWGPVNITPLFQI